MAKLTVTYADGMTASAPWNGGLLVVVDSVGTPHSYRLPSNAVPSVPAVASISLGGTTLTVYKGGAANTNAPDVLTLGAGSTLTLKNCKTDASSVADVTLALGSGSPWKPAASLVVA